MAGIRMDAATLGAGWNTTLTWYAKAVRQMQTRPITDRTSWWYLAAIHGFDQARWVADGLIKATDPLPPAAELSTWDQCQHQTWYFLPWHRGYLHAFEAIVAATVKALGGPANWALPYWNYLAAGSASLKMHAAFTARRLPDRSRNPMSVPPRTNTRLKRAAINLNAMGEKRYTAAPGATAFGGGVTGFNHFGAFAQSGAVELNPHNSVHVRVGGYMEDPNTAALDPIFWLHHCNVDRFWAAWLSRSGNVMENGKPFLDGPAQQFMMPGPDGNLHVFTPGDTMPGGPLAPIYDDLRDGTGAAPSGATALEDVSAEAAMPAKLSSEPPPPARLVGAASGRITVTGSRATTEVKLEPAAAEAAGLQGEQRIFLNLENIRGTAPSASLAVRVGAAGKKASYTQSVALFGLAKASAADGEHGGNGINVAVDITEIAGKLTGTGASLDQLQVSIEQEDAGPNPAPVTVERISIYKQAVD